MQADQSYAGSLPEFMDALTFQGRCQVSFQRVPTPQLQAPTDAIVRIDLSGLCGSDLHPYHCREEGLDLGTVMGHEFVGHVVRAGRWVVQKGREGGREGRELAGPCMSAHAITCRWPAAKVGHLKAALPSWLSCCTLHCRLGSGKLQARRPSAQPLHHKLRHLLLLSQSLDCPVRHASSQKQQQRQQQQPTCPVHCKLRRRYTAWLVTRACRLQAPVGCCHSCQMSASESARLLALALSSMPCLQVCLCEDPSVLGTPFYLMQHVKGRIFTDPSLPGMPPAERAAVYQVRRREGQ